MPTRSALIHARTLCIALAVVLIGLSVVSGAARAGNYSMRSCQTAPGFSTKAFGARASRGMVLKRACNPGGSGVRGMVAYARKRRSGKVKYGASARFTFKAPPGTQIVGVSWSGKRVRKECGFRMDAYAAGGWLGKRQQRFGRTLFENRRCPAKNKRNVTVRQAKAGPRDRGSYKLPGAARVTQRIICAKKRGCSTRGTNYIRTSSVKIILRDVTAPSLRITGGSLARGAWTNGVQTLAYTASDNSGIRNVVLPGSDPIGDSGGSCAQVIALPRPCTDASGLVRINTASLSEGASAVKLQAEDGSGNRGLSANAVTARVDRTPPGRVDTTVAGGEGWRSAQGFGIAWANPNELNRAPVIAAHYQVCPLGSSTGCTNQRAAGSNISRITLNAPKEGQYAVRVWREDAAGNQSRSYASDPVVMRYDPTAPSVAFEPSSASDPTRVSVRVADATSGVARGSLEISREGSGAWQQIPATMAGGRLVGRIRDDQLPAGRYQLRAHAVDRANNERTVVGPTVNLPLRIQSTLKVGFRTTRVVKRKLHTKRHRGKKRKARKGRAASASVRRRPKKARRPRLVRRRTTVLRPVRRIGYGHSSKVAGRLTNRDGQGIAGPLAVYAKTMGGPEQLVGQVRSNGSGHFTYNARGSANRTLRFVYAGTSTILPTQDNVRMVVAQSSSMTTSRRKALNGQSVRFSGQVKSRPLPASGKLIELQVLLSGRWQTFKTARTGPSGRWHAKWRFKRVCGPKPFTYRFRAKLAAEGGSPFAAGKTRPRKVAVRGRRTCG